MFGLLAQFTPRFTAHLPLIGASIPRRDGPDLQLAISYDLVATALDVTGKVISIEPEFHVSNIMYSV